MKAYDNDEFNRQEYEMRDLDPSKIRVQRFIETFVTGKFIEKKNDIDPNAQAQAA
eukprot:CAMPEP_0170499456 /NCGR_PEP_ID=MMETSP0208-20121228/31473_1 /TAXON_ID=197538 /ORGANISM="Strombidium inclinatum, Strain S3" /LENGTH=54 /DNA_ID=CAMNT_0010777011 /DNA_START=62 /DNA_END=226 /DNA_ORIENTATION=+